ncbi:MAG TPA: phospho-N-acetylmuramoyl-pentapeptide-transferase, partial [Caulifigura sp.]|nr:phospho-N-acetylmuramoyl-pentapeptide-transferase [Caulifigura sp.]
MNEAFFVTFCSNFFHQATTIPMLLWLLRSMAPAGEQAAPFLTARIAAAAILSFLAAIAFGPAAVGWLRRKKIGERIDSASETLNRLHAGKRETPTMGGVFIVTAILLSSVLCADPSNNLVRLGLLTVATFAAIGIVDDYTKLTTNRRGLSARAKMLTLGVLSLNIGLGLTLLQNVPDAAGSVELEQVAVDWSLPAFSVVAVGMLWRGFVLLGSSNAVNLSDGLDGLASGCIVCAGTAISAIAYASGHRIIAEHLAIPHVVGAGELAILGAAMIGATLGFLWFNAPPAQIFMGDSGSLPLGGLLAYIAL